MTFVTRLPLLHANDPDPTGWLQSDWRPEPSVVAGVGLLITLYVIWTGRRNRSEHGEQIHPVSRGQRAAFVGGCAALLAALNPPLEDWAEHYLLLAHMAQHLILIFLVAPLLIVGTPPWLLERIVSRVAVVSQVGYALTRPVAAFVVSNLVMAVWHLPVAYNAALTSHPVHIAQHMLFLATALLAWWPVLGRMKIWPSLGPLPSCLYLVLIGFPSGIVGAFITNAEAGLYTIYPDAPRLWGISLADDQVLAGLLMWVGAPLFYLVALTIVFFKWSAAEDAAQRGRRAAPTSPVRP